MTTTLSPTTSAPDQVFGSAIDSAPVAVVAIAASVVAAAVTTGYGAIVIALHGAMRAGDVGASHASKINAFSFGIGTLMTMVLGVLIAALVGRYSSRPAQLWTRISVALLTISLAAPLAASHTDNATRFALAGAHLLAGAIIIPAIRRRLA